VMTAVERPTRTLVSVDAASDPRWADLAEDTVTDVFHSPAWARVLRDGYGFEVRAHLVVDPAGRPVAGIPLVEVDDPRGRRVLSLPFSDFCDPIVDDPADWADLRRVLSRDDRPLTLRLLRHSVDESEGWREVGSYAWHRIDVTRSPDEMWESLRSSARRAIRKARSAGLEVTAATSVDELRAFFEMHLRVRKHKYELLAQPYRFFEAIWEQFLARGDGLLLLARVGKEIVGGTLNLKWRDSLYYKFNASSLGQLEVRPNDLLMWEGMVRAHHQGLAWVDLGVSDWDQEGLIRYKAKYATEEGTVRKLAAGPPLDDGLGAYLHQLTGLLVDPAVPDETTERAGDLLYALFC
jgi:CelD/BcsL family acetyltransferase involved in cellulose biosynthesis